MPHEYCCCAIPILNVGIHFALLEQLVVSLAAAIVTFATPKLLGTDYPGFVPIIFAVLCLIAAGIQVLGFLGVRKNNQRTYRTYQRLNSIVFPVVFAAAAGFIGLAWSRHSAAVTKCLTAFFPDDTNSTSTDGEGRILCKIFTYINTGLLSALWVILLIVQFYMLLVTKFYIRAQEEDEKRYYSVYGDGSPDAILLDERRVGNAWDSHSPPMSPPQRGGLANEGSYYNAPGSDPNAYSHVRQASNASTVHPNDSYVDNEPYLQPNATKRYGDFSPPITSAPLGTMTSMGSMAQPHADYFEPPQGQYSAQPYSEPKGAGTSQYPAQFQPAYDYDTSYAPPAGAPQNQYQPYQNQPPYQPPYQPPSSGRPKSEIELAASASMPVFKPSK